MEQKVHELDARLRQMKEERDQVIQDNEELQDQLDMTNTSASVGIQRINEVKNEVAKLSEEVTRIDYSVTTQEHELKTLSDHMCDLNSLKESVKDHSEEIAIIKDDYTRMKTHLNVSAKLELQTQERVYESRLHHLENVLEEMRQREGHFLHLAEETAVLKDQVDALRELSVMVLKDESSNQQSKSTFPPSALILESPVRSHSNISFKSEENSLEKEILANTMQIEEAEIQQNNNIDEVEVTNAQNETKSLENIAEEGAEDNLSSKSSAHSSQNSLDKNETSQLMTITNSPSASPKSKAVISGSVTLMKPFESHKLSHKKLIEEDDEYDNSKDFAGGCFPQCMIGLWSALFD